MKQVVTNQLLLEKISHSNEILKRVESHLDTVVVEVAKNSHHRIRQSTINRMIGGSIIALLGVMTILGNWFKL